MHIPKGEHVEWCREYSCEGCVEDSFDAGYAAAIDAAREALTEALNALPIKWTSDELFPAVLTIHRVFDSLKEKP